MNLESFLPACKLSFFFRLSLLYCSRINRWRKVRSEHTFICLQESKLNQGSDQEAQGSEGCSTKRCRSERRFRWGREADSLRVQSVKGEWILLSLIHLPVLSLSHYLKNETWQSSSINFIINGPVRKKSERVLSPLHCKVSWIESLCLQSHSSSISFFLSDRCRSEGVIDH